jgi:hypothetical protein
MACHGRGKDKAVVDNLGMAELAAAFVEDEGRDTVVERNLGIDRSRDSSFQHWQRGCKDPMALVHQDIGEEDAHDSSRWCHGEDAALLLEEVEGVSSPFRKSWALRQHEAAFCPGLARFSS